jgi:hypothetical protein
VLAQFAQLQRVCRLVGQHDRGANVELVAGVQKLARSKRAPAGIVVHRLAREHDDWPLGGVVRAHYGAEAVAMRERKGLLRATRL